MLLCVHVGMHVLVYGMCVGNLPTVCPYSHTCAR